jgi:K+/H+ antiporter YhaU regulatory subunit KhtT
MVGGLEILETLGHAVEATQVATIRNRETDIVDASPEGVCERGDHMVLI